MEEPFSELIDKKIRRIQAVCPATTDIYLATVMKVSPTRLEGWRKGFTIPPYLMRVGILKKLNVIKNSHARKINIGSGSSRVGRPPEYDWPAVDWTMTNTQIARALGCTQQAVSYSRRKYAKP